VFTVWEIEIHLPFFPDIHLKHKQHKHTESIKQNSLNMQVGTRPTKRAARALIQILGQHYGFDPKEAIAWIAEKPEWGWINPATTGSATAKQGYQAETHIAGLLNTNAFLRDKYHAFCGTTCDGVFRKLPGTSKTDVTNGVWNLQVKKHAANRFGQVDRRWTQQLIDNVPGLDGPTGEMLGKLCEIPLMPCGQLVDPSRSRVLLSTENYTPEQLTQLTQTLESNKRAIVETVLLGTDPSTQPHHLCGIEYNETGADVTMYRMNDVVEYLLTFDFTITPRHSVIKLGPLSIQRKGGDNKHKSGNNIQFKLVFSSLNIPNKLSETIAM
jgi:hypothetical protein